MRIVPLITAVLVAAVLYGLVMERDRLFSLARDLSPVAEAAEPAETTAPETAVVAETEEAVTPADTAVQVFARRSTAEEINSGVLLRGETEATRQVDVMAETSGRVISTPLRRGAFVEAGQTLCEIDPGTRPAELAEARARLAEAQARRPEVEARIPEAEARVQEARARLDEAMINANAATRLSQDGFASETRVVSTNAAVRAAEAAVRSAEAGVKAARSGLDSLQAGIESAQAAVQRASTEMDRLRVVAPFAGLLESDSAELGAVLQAGAPAGMLCATVLQLDPIKIVGFLPEADVARVEPGAQGGARLIDGTEVTGQVTFLSRSADPVTRTFRVEMTVPNADLAIRDGQTADIAIESDGVMAHLLPASSLTLNDDGDLGVRIVAGDGTALFVPVNLLRDTRAGVWLTGLPEVADVITVGQEFVIDGVAVTPVFEDVLQ